MARAFGDEYDGVVASVEAGFDAFPESVFAFEFEGNFGDENVVDIVRGQRRVGGDKSRFAPHDFDEPEPVDGTDGFGVCGVDRFDGARNGCFETKRSLDEAQIVVDSFGNADDGEFATAFLGFFVERERAFLRAVAADGEEHIDVELLDRIHDFVGFRSTARRSEYRAAVLVDDRDFRWLESDGLIAVFGQEAAVSEGNAEDVAHAVLIPKRHDE